MAVTFVGTQRPVPPIPVGYTRFNTTTSTLEVYDGTSWLAITNNQSLFVMDKQLITKELTFGSLTFYTVEPKGYDWDELYNWSWDTFGPPRDGVRVQETLYSKWFISSGTFHFHEEKHRDWFIIKWSSE